MRDAGAEAAAVAADLAEELAVLVCGDGVLDHAGQAGDHAGAELGVGDRRQGAGLGEPAVVDGGAGLRGVGGGVAGAVDAGGGGLLHLGREVGEVWQWGDGGAGDGDEAVVVGCVEVLVDDAAAPDVVHLRAEEHRHVGELAGFDRVAAVFREEDGDGVVLVLLGAGLVAGGLEGLVAAPFIDVVAEEVDRVGLVAAVEVVGQREPDIRLVGGRVPDRQRLPVSLILDIGLHVSRGGLDERSGGGLIRRIHHLVAGEKANHIIVLLECVDDAGVAGILVDGPLGSVGRDGYVRRGQIRDDIDAGIGQLLHARIVV